MVYRRLEEPSVIRRTLLHTIQIYPMLHLVTRKCAKIYYMVKIMQNTTNNHLKVLVRNNEKLSHQFSEIMPNGSNFNKPP